MNLHHLLSRLPHEVLTQLADEFGIGALTPSKRNLLDALGARYRDAAFISRMVDELSLDSRRLLQALVYFTDPESETLTIPLSFAQAWSRRFPFAEIRQSIFDKGLLFKDHAGKTEGVILPHEIRSLLSTVFQNQSAFPHPTGFTDSGSPYRRIPVLEGLFHLLSLLHRRKALLNRNGTLHHRIFEIWKERPISESSSLPWFQTLLNFASARGLLQKQDNTYRVPSFANEWWMQEELELLRELWNFYLEKEIFPNPDFQLFLMLLLNAADAVRSPSENPIYRLRDFSEVYAKELSQNDTPAETLAIEYFEILQFLGFVEFHRNQPESTFQFTHWGKKILFSLEIPAEKQVLIPEPCVIQPNFDLLVPPSVGYGQLWQIDQTTEFFQRDVLTHFHITRNGILHAMRKGWSTETLLTFFETITAGKIPQNVRYSMEEWCGRYGQVTFQRTVLVQCNSRELADELLHIPEIRELLGERVSDRHYAVPESQARTLFQTLQEKGYEPSGIKRK